MSHFTIIRGGRLLDAAQRQAPFRDILVKNGTIIEVGPSGLAAPEAAEIVDASRHLMHPGLVNSHTHGSGALTRGFRDRWNLEMLLMAAPVRFGNQSAEIKYLNTYLGAVEMALKGCTVAYDLTFGVPVATTEELIAMGQAYRDVGIRAVMAPMLSDISFYRAVPGLVDSLPPALAALVGVDDADAADGILAQMRAALSAWPHDRDHVKLGVAPTIPTHCSDRLMQGSDRLVREFDTVMQSHVGESKIQALAALEFWGESMVAHIDRLGLIGPHFSVAHGVWLDDDDMRRLADKGASVSHNAGSNMRLGAGIANSRRMLELGVNLGIGTDGPTSSDNQNMYEAIRAAQVASCVRQPDHRLWLSAPEAFRAATEGGARLAGFDHVGAIAPGKRADIVFLALDHPNWMPINDPANQVVLVEDATAVRHVMVDGRFIVRDGRHLASDMVALAGKAEAAREKIAAMNAADMAATERLEEAVTHFCRSLAAKPYHVERYAAFPCRCAAAGERFEASPG